jgi:hypothetical protein
MLRCATSRLLSRAIRTLSPNAENPLSARDAALLKRLFTHIRIAVNWLEKIVGHASTRETMHISSRNAAHAREELIADFSIQPTSRSTGKPPQASRLSHSSWSRVVNRTGQGTRCGMALQTPAAQLRKKRSRAQLLSELCLAAYSPLSERVSRFIVDPLPHRRVAGR